MIFNGRLNSADLTYNLTFSPSETNVGLREHTPVDTQVLIAGGSVNSQPHIVRYDIHASNEKSCSVNQSQTY